MTIKIKLTPKNPTRADGTKRPAITLTKKPVRKIKRRGNYA